MDESTEFTEPDVVIATEIPECLDTSDLQEIDPSDEETIEDLDPPQIPESELKAEEVLHTPNLVTESEFVSEEVQDLDTLKGDCEQELDSANTDSGDNTTNESCDIPKEFQNSDEKLLQDEGESVDKIDEKNKQEESDNDFVKIDESEIPKTEELDKTELQTQENKSEEVSQESSEVKQETPTENSQESKNTDEITNTESESRQNESSNLTDEQKTEPDSNENIEKNTDANVGDKQTIES